MNYEEKYKEAIEGIQEILSSGQESITMSRLKLRLQGIFPELKESNDEKVIKALIRFHKSTIDIDGIKGDDIIAWLEKQGEKESDPRYKCLKELLAADAIYQMSMNDEMVQEAKEKAVNALSEMCIGRLLGLENQDGLEKQKGETLSGWWVARDKNGDLYVYSVKPEMNGDSWVVADSQNLWKMPNILFSDLKWEDEPMKLDVTLKPKTT